MNLDPIKEPLIRLVLKATQRMDYHALYSCKVVSQNADGTLELQPDRTTLSSVSKVPIRLGLPGVEVKVAAGSRVLLGFENGDPAKPVATLWEKSTLNEIVVTAATKVTVTSPSVELGGTPAIQPVIQGQTYVTAEATMLTSLAAALTAVGTAISSIATITSGGAAASTACGAAVTAIGTFATAATGSLSTKVKTQ